MSSGVIFQVPKPMLNEPVVQRSTIKQVAKTTFAAMTDAAQKMSDAVTPGVVKPTGDTSSKGQSIATGGSSIKPVDPNVTPSGPAMTDDQKASVGLVWIGVAIAIGVVVMYKYPNLLGSIGNTLSFR
jgi:hypothetical protein